MDMKTLWKGKFISVVSPDKYPYEAISEKDGVCVLPILIGHKNGPLFGLRRELIPPYTVKSGDKMFYTAISGGIEEGENAQQTMVRELKEEAGLTLQRYTVVYHKPMHTMKASVNLVHFVIIKVMEWESGNPTTDGTRYEKVAHTEFVTEEELEEILRRDNVDFLLTGLVSIYRNQVA